MRALHVICDKLHLIATGSPRDRFLRTVAGFMIEFHDYVQGNKGGFKSVELATAAQLIEWLTTAPALADAPDLKKIIEYMANQIIVLGTTFVFSRQQTSDLSQLFLMMERAAIEVRIPVGSPSNMELINLMRLIMLLTGVIDKNPAAIPAIAIMQSADASTNSLSVIKRYSHRPTLLLERFFASTRFTPYFGGETPTHLDVQNFLITLVPHLCMRAELSASSKPDVVHAYIDFINACRKGLSVSHTVPEFMLWFDRQFSAQRMTHVVHSLFFDIAAINGETAFSYSQIGGLQYVNRILSLLVDTDDPLINPTVPETDALNLVAFKAFYDRLDLIEKSTLIREMLMTVVLQAGTSYRTRPDLTYSPSATTEGLDARAVATTRLTTYPPRPSTAARATLFNGSRTAANGEEASIRALPTARRPL